MVNVHLTTQQMRGNGSSSILNLLAEELTEREAAVRL
jgi:hypothetical protein